MIFFLVDVVINRNLVDRLSTKKFANFCK